jgi:predicted phosphate transport protein (TIGR00153 family)
MRIPFLSIFIASPFDGLKEHADKVKECAWSFQEAIECHISDKCTRFEEIRKEIIRMEQEADAVKRRIRGHLPKGTLLAVDKFELFRYLGEQDNVIDSLEDALDWISYRKDPGIPEALEKDFLLFVDSVIAPVEELSRMVTAAREYFGSYSERQRVAVKDIIKTLREQERSADKHEARIREKVMNMPIDPVTVFQMVRLAETIGAIADHAQNAGDMMRAMIAK